MSSQSKLVQTNRSLIVLDPQGMPINLGHSVREDEPENSFPALAYDGKNILPTALGYKSFFGTSTRLEGSMLEDKRVQKILVYQSVGLSSLLLALCEDGIYIKNAGSADEWEQLVEREEIEGLRRQWTFCVIKNILYLYQQGMDGFYGIVDPATYEETDIPVVIEDALIEQEWLSEDWQTGLLKYTPNFINITAQIGLFKAGNRLGFWDSEDAVAWSSATQIYDFKPSTTSFAGITTFTDVVGRIVAIHQHGTGFIIYATRSITLCSATPGSPEKWAGRAIFSDVGMLFDVQVAVAQPDTVHYAITSGGICVIDQGQAQFTQPEVFDYIKRANQIYSLSFIDARYLFVHLTNNASIPAPVITVQLPDRDGNEFTFPAPIEDLSDDFEDAIIEWLNGLPRGIQGDFTEAMDDLNDPIPIPPLQEEQLMVPCFTGRTMGTNFNQGIVDNSITTTRTILVPSGITDYEWPVEVQFEAPLHNFNNYDLGDNFIDQAGAPMLTLMNEFFEQVQSLRDIVVEGVEKFAPATIESVGLNGAPHYANYLSALLEDVATPNQFEWFTLSSQSQGEPLFTWNRVVDVSDFSAPYELSNCDQQIHLPLIDVEFRVTVNMTERYRLAQRGQQEVHTSAATGSLELVATLRMNYGPLVRVFYDSLSFNVTAARYNYTIIGSPAGTTAILLGTEKPSSYTVTRSSGGGDFTPNFIPETVNLSVAYLIDQFAGPIFDYGVQTVDVNPPLGSCPLFVEVVVEPAGPPIAARTPYGPWMGAVFGSSIIGTYSQETYEWQPTNSVTCAQDRFNSTLRTRRIGSCSTAPVLDYGFIVNDPSLPQVVVVELIASSITVQPIYTLRPEEEWPEVFRATISGWGKPPVPPWSFRRTHTRSPFTPCDPPSRYKWITFPDQVRTAEENFAYPAIPPYPDTIRPPLTWDQQPPIPLPPNYILLQDGTASPYYPTYKEALVFDSQLGKWGLYSDDHKLVYPLLPINRVDQTIVPINNPGMLAGSLLEDGELSVFTAENPTSSITYGKIGDYRLGTSTYTKLTAQFLGAPDVYTIVDVSLDGQTIVESLSQATHITDNTFMGMPFTLTGKWLNIRLSGTFDLVNLALESKRAGRR